MHAASVSEHATTPIHVQIHSCDYLVGLWKWMGGWAGMLQLLHKPQVNETKRHFMHVMMLVDGWVGGHASVAAQTFWK